jgi:hypothetical protein
MINVRILNNYIFIDDLNQINFFSMWFLIGNYLKSVLLILVFEAIFVIIPFQTSLIFSKENKFERICIFAGDIFSKLS